MFWAQEILFDKYRNFGCRIVMFRGEYSGKASIIQCPFQNEFQHVHSDFGESTRKEH